MNKTNDNIIVEFNYESNSIKIQGKKDEKMKDIYQRYLINQDKISATKKYILVIMANGAMILMERRI